MNKHGIYDNYVKILGAFFFILTLSSNSKNLLTLIAVYYTCLSVTNKFKTLLNSQLNAQLKY